MKERNSDLVQRERRVSTSVLVVSDVIARMKQAAMVEKDAELAAFLGLPRSTISSWRQRNSIPYAECVQIALQQRESLDWLITGERSFSLSPGIAESGIDWRILAHVLLLLDRANVLGEIEDPIRRAETRARFIALEYARVKNLVEVEASKLGIDRELFVESVGRILAREEGP